MSDFFLKLRFSFKQIETPVKFSSIMKTFGLGNQNCNMTELDFLLLIAGKPLVKLYSLQVSSAPSSMVHGGRGNYIHGNQIGEFLKKVQPMPLRCL